MRSNIILINGVASHSIDVSDRGLHYGDGLFETMLCENNKIVLLDQHIQRLFRGCRRLKIAQPEASLLLSEIESVCNSRHYKSVIKLILTRGSGGTGFCPADHEPATRIIKTANYPENYSELKQSGIKVHICQTRLSHNPLLAGVKHLNRLEQVLASSERSGSAYNEGIMLDQKGYLVEGTKSNLFMIKNNSLVTPDLTNSGVLGVFREAIIDVCLSAGIDVEVRAVKMDELDDFDGVFMSNAVSGILPVIMIDKKPLAMHAMISQLNHLLPF